MKRENYILFTDFLFPIENKQLLHFAIMQWNRVGGGDLTTDPISTVSLSMPLKGIMRAGEATGGYNIPTVLDSKSPDIFSRHRKKT